MEELFKKSKVRLGDSVVIETKNATHVGILIPRYEYADVNHLVLKLKNGYNIGINLEKIKSIKKIPEKLDPSYMSDTDHKYKDSLSDRDNVQDSPDSPGRCDHSRGRDRTPGGPVDHPLLAAHPAPGGGGCHHRPGGAVRPQESQRQGDRLCVGHNQPAQR